MVNAVFGKTMENVMKSRDIKLVTTDKRRNQLVSEPNYHITKYFSENLLAIEMKKTKVKMNTVFPLISSGPQISAAFLGTHIEISASLYLISASFLISPTTQNEVRIRIVTIFY